MKRSTSSSSLDLASSSVIGGIAAKTIKPSKPKPFKAAKGPAQAKAKQVASKSAAPKAQVPAKPKATRETKKAVAKPNVKKEPVRKPAVKPGYNPQTGKKYDTVDLREFEDKPGRVPVKRPRKR